MEIIENKIDGQPIIALIGRIDSTSAATFEEKLIELIELENYTMIIDFLHVQFISSAGLRVLLLAAKKIKSHGGKLLLCDMPKDVREVFDISGFSSIFEIHENVTTAVNALKKAL